MAERYLTEENKAIIEEQLHIILSGTDILLSLNEMSVRSANLVKKIQEAGDILYSKINSKEELEQYLLSHVRRYKDNKMEAIEGIEDSAKLEIIDSYIREIKRINANLEKYYKEDMELFRIKVHGLKSMSKQIGNMRMGENAEIMEMAAKAGHLTFIEKNLKSFLADIRVTLEAAQYERDKVARRMKLAGKQENSNPGKPSYTSEETEVFLARLKKAFDEFALDDIEEYIGKLKKVAFPSEKQKLFAEACRAAEDLEYERGSTLIEKIWRD